MGKKIQVLLLVYFMAIVVGLGSLSWVATKESNEKELQKMQVKEAFGKLPLHFIENTGQTDHRVRYYEKGATGHAMYFTKRGVYLSLVGSTGQEAEGRQVDTSEICGERSRINHNPKSKIVKLIPLGANNAPEIVAEGLQSGKVNYFIGNDPKKWKTNIPTYQAIVYKDVYQNIDMKFYGNNRQMEYDIIVKPDANPSRVQLSYEGIDGLTIAENGDLEISLKEGKVIQRKPYVYQEIDGKRVEIEGKFKISDQNCKSKIVNHKYVYGFTVASYDKRYPLVIDPTIAYSTYLGGSSNEIGFGIAVDSAGNAYVTGYTDSSDFPLTNAIERSLDGDFDVFVTKIDASGTSLSYSTYLGGSSNELGSSIAVDSAGNAYVTGRAFSSDFPMVNAIDASLDGFADAFVTKIDASGTSLLYSTYLGGSSFDIGSGIAVDSAGNAYVTGRRILLISRR